MTQINISKKEKKKRKKEKKRKDEKSLPKGH